MIKGLLSDRVHQPLFKGGPDGAGAQRGQIQIHVEI